MNYSLILTILKRYTFAAFLLCSVMIFNSNAQDLNDFPAWNLKVKTSYEAAEIINILENAGVNNSVAVNLQAYKDTIIELDREEKKILDDQQVIDQQFQNNEIDPSDAEIQIVGLKQELEIIREKRIEIIKSLTEIKSQL